MNLLLPEVVSAALAIVHWNLCYDRPVKAMAVLARLISPFLSRDQLLLVSSSVAAKVPQAEVPTVVKSWQLPSQLSQLEVLLPCSVVVLVLEQQVVEEQLVIRSSLSPQAQQQNHCCL